MTMHKNSAPFNLQETPNQDQNAHYNLIGKVLFL
jgi:hypothetical protein